MHPRPSNTLGPRPEHGVGVSFPGCPLGPAECRDVPRGRQVHQAKMCQPDRQGHGHHPGECSGITGLSPPGQRAASLRPRPLPQFPPASPLLRFAAPTGRARAVTLRRRGGAKTPRESGGGAASEGRARAPLPRARAAPPQPRPPRHLSCGSCASPSRAAASLRPPSSLLPQSPLRLHRTAYAARARPPPPLIGSVRLAPGPGDDAHWAP